MKKILLLILIVTQFGFSQTYFSEDFQGETSASLTTTGWVFYNDSNTPQPGYLPIFGTNAWAPVTWIDEGTNTTLSSTSWFQPAGIADRWAVTPAITLPAGANASLRFKVRSHDPDFPDGYVLRVSTTNNQKASFLSSAPLLTVAEAPNNTIANIANTTVDLSAYNGQTIYLAWINNSNDSNLLSIDDIAVEGSCAGVSGLTFESFTTTTAVVNIGATADYQVEYGVFPYIQGTGGTILNLTNTNTFTLTGLTPGISYTVFVRRNCGAGAFGGWSSEDVGTLPLTTTTFPYTNNFEIAENQAYIFNIGLSFANLTGTWTLFADNPAMPTLPVFAFSGIRFIGSGLFADDAHNAFAYVNAMQLTTGNQYTITFKHRVQSNAATTIPMSLNVVVGTTNDGLNSTTLETFTNLTNLNYVDRVASFTPTTSGVYYFGFLNNTAPNTTPGGTINRNFIDDVTVTETLSTDKFDAVKVAVFPNPVRDILNINLLESITAKVSISDINGRTVKNININEANASINVSDLSSGVYMLNITTDKGTSTKKIIKQ